MDWCGLRCEECPDPRTDDELAQAWQAGDAEALGTLFARHLRLLYRWLRPWRWDHEWEDLAQEAALGWMEAVRRWDPVQARLSTFAWYYALRRVRRYLSQRLAVEVWSLDAPDVLDEDMAFGDRLADERAEEELQRVESEVWWQQTLATLPPRQAEVLEARLAVAGGATATEVARRIGVSRQAVHQAERRALTRLRAALGSGR